MLISAVALLLACCLKWSRSGVQSPRRMKWLFRIVHDFDAIHTRHSRNRYKSEQDLALGVRPNRGKAPVDGAPFSTSLLHDVEAPQQGHAVTVDVKDATAKFARAGGAPSIVPFTEFQRDSIPALRHGHSVGKMSPTLARVERHVRCG